MTYEQAFTGYQNAYNSKLAAQNNPLNSSGIIAIEETKLTGQIPLSLVAEFDATLETVTTSIPKEIDSYNSLMEDFKPIILDFFRERAKGETSVLMPNGQIISANNDVIIVDGPAFTPPPDGSV